MTRDAAQLRDEIALREASLADAQRERSAGELSDEQFDLIHARESNALAQARLDLAAVVHTPTPTPSLRPRVRRRRWLLLAVLCFAVVLGGVLVAALSPRQAGNSGTGSLSLSTSQAVQRLLTQAEADVANGDVTAALSAYQQVLALSPTNVAALTESGWLDFSAGSAAKDATLVEVGVKDLEKAIALAPREAAPRLYFAIVADATPGNQKVARTEFEEFLRLRPSKGQMVIARPFLRRLGLVK